jgi:hypothetical protein
VSVRVQLGKWKVEEVGLTFVEDGSEESWLSLTGFRGSGSEEGREEVVRSDGRVC